MTAWIFVIRHRDSRKIVGGALVALEARYLACCYADAPRLDRRFAPPSLWREIRHAFSVGLPTTVLSSSSVLPAVLLGAKGVDLQLQWLKAIEIEVAEPESAVPLLDNALIRETGALSVPAQRVG